MSRPPRLTDPELEAWLREHPEWTLENDHLVRALRTDSYANGAAIVAAQVPLAESLDHHPVLTLGYRTVRLELWTHDRGGVTSLDVAYAQAFDELLHERFADVLTD